MTNSTRTPLARIHELARMRASAALQRVAAAETRATAAQRAAAAERDAKAELAATQADSRAERIAGMLAGPATPVRLARIGLQYDIDVEDLAAQDRRIAQRQAEADAKLRELERERAEARIANNREIKLGASLERIGRGERLAEEGASDEDAGDR